jgi:diguanylate cyclase (GGDEF)-like protein
MVDVDRLKQVNDQHGHATGDEVLRTVALALRRTLRQVDLAGRYGGDELVVALPETTIAMAGGLVQRLHAVVRDTYVPSTSTHILISVSVGLASTEAAPDVSLEALLDQADQAMYQAKGAQRVARRPSDRRW